MGCDGGDGVLHGVELKHDTTFYHGSKSKLSEINPTPMYSEKAVGFKPVKVVNLGDRQMAEAWGQHIHEVVIPKGTRIFQGMDGSNHVVVMGKVKVSKVSRNTALGHD